MGKKADGNHTPEPLPLDDRRWVSATVIAERLIERLRDGHDAVRDLEKALAKGDPRSMVRSGSAGKPERLTPADWTKLKLTWWRGIPGGEPNFVSVDYRERGPKRYHGRIYVWQPDADRLWWLLADSTPVEHDDASDAPPQRVKPGRKPTSDWPDLIAQWLITVAVEDPKRLQNVDALVTEAKLFLHNQIKWAPKQNKELRAIIVELLKRVRR